LLVKRVLYQNTEDIKFVRFLTRLSLGYESSYGKKVAEKCLALLKAVDITTVTGEVTLKYKNLYDKRLRTPKPGYGPNTVNPQYYSIRT